MTESDFFCFFLYFFRINESNKEIKKLFFENTRICHTFVTLGVVYLTKRTIRRVSIKEYTYTADGRTEKFRTVMPDVFEDAQDLTHKLVYIPFEYAEGEWNNIIRRY